LILKRISTAIREQDWAAVAIEFVVVVLGIFVALQAEGWYQERENRRLEQVYLSRLTEETRANLETLRQHEKIYESKVQFVLALPNMDLISIVEDDPGAFMQWLDHSSYIALPDMRSESFDELESSGRLTLLRDARLRTEIVGNLNDYRSARPVFDSPIGDYRRLLFEILPGQSYYAFRNESGAEDAAAIAASMEVLRSDPRFRAAANAEISYGSDVLYWVRVFIERSEHVLDLLEASESQ
jgi:hypothetical protein